MLKEMQEMLKELFSIIPCTFFLYISFTYYLLQEMKEIFRVVDIN